MVEQGIQVTRPATSFSCVAARRRHVHALLQVRRPFGVCARVTAFGEVALGRLAPVRVVRAIARAIPPVVGVAGRDAGRGQLAEEAVGASVLRPLGSAIGSRLRVRALKAGGGERGVIGADLNDSDVGRGGGELVQLIKVDQSTGPLRVRPVSSGHTGGLAEASCRRVASARCGESVRRWLLAVCA